MANMKFAILLLTEIAAFDFHCSITIADQNLFPKNQRPGLPEKAEQHTSP